ncbi:MAG TPA: hypothetical protein VL625_06625 [Patescibacteria group bacterium]|nr:hypothetical protein [Patescibacteria group bacterium]
MKFCMILAGDTAFTINACRASDNLGYARLDTENGFHSYKTGDHESVNLAVIDMDTMQPERIIEKLHAIGQERKLMPFCMSPKDAARLKSLMGSELTCTIPLDQMN